MEESGAEQAPAVPSIKEHRATHKSFVTEHGDSGPEKPSAVVVLRMKKALNEKDALIASHRTMIAQLYRHICGLNDTVQRLKQTVAVLKGSLLKNNLRLPDIHHDNKSLSQTATQWNSDHSLVTAPESTIGTTLETLLKSAALIANYKESPGPICYPREASKQLDSYATEYELYFAQHVNQPSRTGNGPVVRALNTAAGTRRSRQQSRRTGSRRDRLQALRGVSGKKAGATQPAAELPEFYGGEYGFNSRTSSFATTHSKMRMPSPFAGSPEENFTNKSRVGTDRGDTTLRTSPGKSSAGLASKLRKMLQAGDLLADIIDTNMNGEEMQIMTKFMLGDAAKDMFRERLRTMMYRVLGLFFYLRTYSHGPQKPDDHLAHIVPLSGSLQIDMLTVALDSERCIMYVYDPAAKLLQTKAARGAKIECFTVAPEKGRAEATQFLVGIVGYVYTNCTGVVLRSPYEDARFDRTIDQQRKSITRTMMCVPLKTGDSCLGCVEVANKRGGAYTEQDYQMLQSAVNEVATGIAVQNLQHAFQEHGKDSETFRVKVGQLAGENMLGPLLKSVLIILTDLLKSEKYEVGHQTENRTMLYVKSSAEDTIVLSEVSNAGVTMSKSPPELDIKSGCAGAAFSSKEVVFEPFAQSSQNINRQEIDPELVGTTVHSIIAVPIFDEHGKSIGVFEVLNSDKGNFSSPSVKPLLTKFAKYISLLFYTNGLLKNTLESFEIFSVSLDNVGDAVLVSDWNGNITMSNVAARLMLGLQEEETVGWKVVDLFKSNGHILAAYYKLLEGKEAQHLFNTQLVVNKGEKGTDSLAVNFRCLGINTDKGGSGSVLFLLQPISAKTVVQQQQCQDAEGELQQQQSKSICAY